MSTKLKIITLFSLIILGIGTGCCWKQDAPRRLCLKALAELDSVIGFSALDRLIGRIVLPQPLQGRTAAEQVEFVSKVLRDEISPEGIACLIAHGSFGSLKQLFLGAGKRWTKKAGIDPSKCAAFKLQQREVRNEVVFFPDGDGCRAVPCKNLIQLAAAK